MNKLNNLVLFFDGCHKIYFAEITDQATIDQMKEYGYPVMSNNFSKDLDECWRASCSLKFVEHAAFDPKAPKVYQFQKGGLRGFRTNLKQWLVFQEGARTKI